MNSLERFHASVNYEPKDRIMYWGFPIRESTLNRWHKEGLPEAIDPHDLFGFDRWEGIPAHIGHFPQFEPETIEETERYKIWRDPEGAIRKDFKEILNPGFITRSWLKFPVEDRKDFVKMQERYNADDPGRFASEWSMVKARLPERDCPVSWMILGPFFVIRQWMGFDNFLVAFYDHPDLIREMVEFITDFTCRLLKNALDNDDVEMDLLIIAEDMAYKHSPMIGPEMCRDFLLESYRRINNAARQYGTKYIVVDSDGYGNPLVPVWMEAGIDGFLPMEVAAGVDAVELRKEYGPKLLMFGNVDKRELAKGPDAIHREVARTMPLAVEGGFIIGVDHAVPHDVSFDNYVSYVETLRRLGGTRR